ncbi:hypothetical protein H9635_13960 [Solibacillus sp. A46]|uniref:Uncharacterized protein n=1 Tax=Solibacillus faecavium TaxID=2762221 RepID=A0ABR8Y0Z8_9BACL|nr:hypothetical protein [Solibacillus faecavium]MBD8037851.1 hypothetical protein [Solibacillus faecavium]
MNNFRNPYVDPDSFQNKVYDNYKNQTIPQDIHFSFNNQGEFEERKTQHSRKNKQADKILKNAIYINNQLESITDPKPVMFSPPKVDSIQNPLNEDPVDKLIVNNNQNKKTENEKMDKKDVVSDLFEEFSNMLEDNPSIQEEFTTNQENPFDNDTALITQESTSMPENKLAVDNNNADTENSVQTKNENSRMLFAEFHSMLDKRNNDLISEEENNKSFNNKDTIDEKVLLMFLENDEMQEEDLYSDRNEENMDALNEITDPIEEKFLTMLSENDELQEENQDITMFEEEVDELNETADLIEEKFLTMLTESDELQGKKSDELLEKKQDNQMNEEDISELNETTETIEDEYFTMLTESDELQEEKQDSLFPSLEEKKSGEKEALSNFRDIHFINNIDKRNTATVKMKVLLSRLETEIDIVETVKLLRPIENIGKVEWSIQSLDCKVVLPSKTVFLKGEFVADIEFSNKGLGSRIQSIKVSIPWSKTSSINWLAVPDYPHSSQNEFQFQSHNEHTSSFHYESHHKFSEPIHSHLKQTDFVWHQELNSKDKHLQVNGVAQLSIDFVQEQYIELDCYSK